ncbi:uncharacterized protein BCR38DRAFT_493640 [Pseudomassariella vexata]|uniref:Secreted protein n=1 Tax=Pseudomassariella vexata TaxID=1141098 RepID=A0A1Y2EKP3_9PEZI|nr:uncharacterized protein BCR38DRAFT_493640 [Pseudomassariella vexata]ORY71866.1 hypothetical protein BCR38DRAFT_493640 [Pseudomassariella vexata]
MRFTLIALVPLALAIPFPGSTPVTAPAPGGVTIKAIKFAGSGCKAGSVESQLSSDKTTLTLLYDSFTAEAGEGIRASNARKNCQLNAAIKYPGGWQFSIFKADYRGSATLGKGDKGVCKATYYFSGDSQQVCISSSKTIDGPYDSGYIKTDEFLVSSKVWSPCGAEGLLNINSEISVKPKDLKAKPYMSVYSTDLKFTQLLYLQWRPCTK